ncbi:MAG: OadG family protein [Treponema sp.]|jgi:oxaloacetate decarboxylase gamma subunit|nr:OadG family protein [Treponema sp.]
MTIAEMLEQSGVLALLGMGMVFCFLIIMIVAVTFMGKVIHALGADKDPGVPAGGGSSVPVSGAGNNAAVTAAISAAVNEYRKGK